MLSLWRKRGEGGNRLRDKDKYDLLFCRESEVKKDDENGFPNRPGLHRGEQRLHLQTGSRYAAEEKEINKFFFPLGIREIGARA